ncbi:hypothetical protein AK973_2066 [Pseudomonas brassicacearum]|nr:hypothetical protein AK973_2066 [Pseudomonas brassicacearum]
MRAFLFARLLDPCGIGLARDGGGTFNMDASWLTAIASKLAPTRDHT